MAIMRHLLLETVAMTDDSSNTLLLMSYSQLHSFSVQLQTKIQHVLILIINSLLLVLELEPGS